MRILNLGPRTVLLRFPAEVKIIGPEEIRMPTPTQVLEPGASCDVSDADARRLLTAHEADGLVRFVPKGPSGPPSRWWWVRYWLTVRWLHIEARWRRGTVSFQDLVHRRMGKLLKEVS